MNDNSNLLTEEAGRIAGIAEKVLGAMDTFQRGKCISETDMAALHDAMEFLSEAESGVEAVDAFNRRHKLSHFWNLSDIRTLNAAVWYLSARKYTEYRPDAVHEILREIRAWCALLHKLEYTEPLDDREMKEFAALRQFFKESELLAERVARGEPLPKLYIEPATQETPQSIHA